MINKEILKKAIEKAVRNLPNKRLDKWSVLAFVNKENKFKCSEIEKEDIFNIIFDHDFAKAFWGEEEVAHYTVTIATKNGGEQDYSRIFNSYKHHIQQMVLEENPIKYLEQFI